MDFGLDQINCTRISESVIQCDGHKFDTVDTIAVGSGTFYEYVAISIGLVLLGGLFSGLTLGLLSLDQLNLEVLSKGGHPHEQRFASALIPLVKHHHLLLVTLLLSNAAVNEALPLFLDKLVPSPIFAILISVTAVLLFGEVIPQSLCSRHGLAIGYYMRWIVMLMMVVLLPIAWPIAKLLDCLLGHEAGAFFRRAEFSVFVDLHANPEIKDNEEPLIKDEVTVIQGVLAMHSKCAGQCMTSISDLFMLPNTACLDDATMTKIISSGHSRVPIFDVSQPESPPTQFFLVKHLIKFNPAAASPITEAPLHKLPYIEHDCSLFDLLNIFQDGVHIAAVLQNGSICGLITMEDVMEELIGEEIVDETDVYADLHKKVERNIGANRPDLLAKAMFPARQASLSSANSNSSYTRSLLRKAKSIDPTQSFLRDDRSPRLDAYIFTASTVSNHKVSAVPSRYKRKMTLSEEDGVRTLSYASSIHSDTMRSTSKRSISQYGSNTTGLSVNNDDDDDVKETDSLLPK